MTSLWTQRRIAGAGLLFLCLAAAGCATSNNRLYVAKLQTPADIEKNADNYWEVQNVPRSGKDKPRIAIIDFSVQFVRSDGSASKSPDVSRGLQLELPGLLHSTFHSTVAAMGGIPLSIESVATAGSYAHFEGTALADIAPISFADTEGETEWFPVDGLLAISSTPDEINDAVQSLLEELNADVAMQIHLRLTLYKGYPVIAKGSTVAVFSKGEHGTLVSQTDLVARTSVVDPSSKKIAAVTSQKYVPVAAQLFEPFVSMAVEATQ